MSGFSSLNVGAQALFAAQRALDVTGQNVSNANTEGYSRQRVQQTARGASVVPAMFARSDASTGGVDILGTQRIRDGFLEARAHQEHATGAGLGALSGTYADIEATFGEPSKTGLQSQLSSFWNVVVHRGQRPGRLRPAQPAARAGRHPRRHRQRLQHPADAAVVGDPRPGRDHGRRRQLDDGPRWPGSTPRSRSATLDGGQPNELADQRDLLVTRIAEATGAVATPGDGGVVNLTLGGRTLVNGDHSAQLQAVGPTSYPATDRHRRRELGRQRPAGDHRQWRPLRSADGGQHHPPGTMSDLDTVAATLARRQHPAGSRVSTATGARAVPSSPVRRPPRCASS